MFFWVRVFKAFLQIYVFLVVFQRNVIRVCFFQVKTKKCLELVGKVLRKMKVIHSGRICCFFPCFQYPEVSKPEKMPVISHIKTFNINSLTT